MTTDHTPPPYRMTAATPRPHRDTLSLVDELLAAWLKQEGHEEPPPPAADAPPERLRLGERILLDRDSGPLTTSLASVTPAPPALPVQPTPLASTASTATSDALAARFSRRRLRTPAPHGTAQLTVTVASEHADGPSLVRLEAEHLPAGQGVRTAGRVHVPELAHTLLPLLDAADGPVLLSTVPQTVRPEDVDDLIDELCDPARRLPVVVASVPPAVPVETWAAEVLHPLLRQLPGLASLYVLGHTALPRFNLALEYHKVYGGAVRTYLPEVDPASRYDSVRHPVLPRQRIDEDVRRAAALLAREPRRIAAELPLPALLAAVPVLQLPPEARRHPAEGRRPHPAAVPREAADTLRSAADGYECTELDRRERQARADELQRAHRSLHRARRREVRLLAETDEQYAALRHVSAQVRVLTGRLRTVAGADAVDLAGLTAEALADEGSAPGSFNELVGRFTEFPLLEFTGDSKETLALDGQCDGVGWARLTWEGLTALQEYAAAAVRGEAGGDFKQWCEHTPPGCHRFPPRKAVRGESRTVTSHAKWKRQRMLPVPACVDSSRRAFMGAHLRIGGGGTAPRVHYLDDCSGSGRIYVGYIGLHLSNTRTN
ncbi:hypothetical protein GCM10010441_76480 [Kitasatospora paracochleata]|uniref:Uncharacterized protein n=1 Tax=Kitasatospora paracochleata TaxID=58354 RepID=A0ABT1IYN7_9ACTN|nr:hypothetical protein [Kitasatospora paracochleata]MCP2310270.1 hypothetical protein [Kitasatospora paracochleata]